MGLLDFLRGGDTVERLVSETQGFLTKFEKLLERTTELRENTEVMREAEAHLHEKKLDGFRTMYDRQVVAENTRWDGVAQKLDSDIVALNENMEIANKIVSFFRDWTRKVYIPFPLFILK